MVDRPRQIVEEPLHRGRVVGVESGAPACSDVARRLGEPFGVAPGDEDVGALAAGAAGGLEADSRATAKHDDGLAEQRRLARGDGRGGFCGHGSSDRSSVMTVPRGDHHRHHCISPTQGGAGGPYL